MTSQDHSQVRPPVEFPVVCPVNLNTFPGKLWKLVNDDYYQSIRWTDNGTTIGIDALKFKHEVLKRDDFTIFKTKNFSSFVRQLNLYGFRKLTAVHPSSRHCEFSENHAHHAHSRHQLNSDLQQFQHSYFARAHPERLIRVRRASAAQKRKAHDLLPHGHGGGSQHSLFGLRTRDSPEDIVMRDRTNLHRLYHQPRRGTVPVQLGLQVTQGKIFGLSLLASTSRGSLIATPPSGQIDVSALCNRQGQLRRFVVIGPQDHSTSSYLDGEPMFLADTRLLSPMPPVLEAYNMSPLANPYSSLGYAMAQGSLDTSISEAEGAVAFLMNDSFESSLGASPQQLSPLHQSLPSHREQYSRARDGINYNNSSFHLSSDDINEEISPRYSSTSSSSHLSAPSVSTFFSAANSSSSTFSSSSYPSTFPSSSLSSGPSTYFCPSSSSTNLEPSSSSNLLGYSIDPSSLSQQSSGSDNHIPSSPSSTDYLVGTHGSDIINSAFMSAIQNESLVECKPPVGMSPPNFCSTDTLHQSSASSLIVKRSHSPVDDDQLATPLPPSPDGFTIGQKHDATSLPIVAGHDVETNRPEYCVENIKVEPHSVQ